MKETTAKTSNYASLTTNWLWGTPSTHGVGVRTLLLWSQPSYLKFSQNLFPNCCLDMEVGTCKTTYNTLILLIDHQFIIN